jgi:putative pyoverdin transport system ATP-binding/permease protein
MNFLRFLKRETQRPLHNILTMAGLSGITNAVLLAIINAVAGGAGGGGGSGSSGGGSQQPLNFRSFLMFAIALTLFVICQKYILHRSTIIIEEILAKVRVRVSNKLRKADLLSLENIEQKEIYNRLTQETMVISNSAALLILSVQSAIMLFFVGIYIAILSIVAFIVISLLLVSAIIHYMNNQKKQQEGLRRSNENEMAFFDSVTDLLVGAKEIRFDTKRSKSMFAFLKTISGALKSSKITTAIGYANNMIFAQSFYYFLIGTIIFIMPRLFTTYTDSLTQITAAILFTIGPTSNIVGAIQTFDQVDFAVANIYRLEAELEKIAEIHDDRKEYDHRLRGVSAFKKIRLEEVSFSYRNDSGENGFSIGPFNLEIRAGETMFIAGGNGSGKTTFLKVLSMLYYPDKGSILLDDTRIVPANTLDYRNLFSAVFSDFHLFSRLYGLEDVKGQKVNELLKIMEIDKKTRFLGDRFSTLDLSTGQRKRLAMVVALLEDKPIYIFDEWAAEQDPEFRTYFYEIILDDLKKKGKTIIAASHDDRFFHFADRVIKMDYGRMIKDEGDPLE